MKDMDKTVEVVKAAMEKEEKEKQEASRAEKIDGHEACDGSKECKTECRDEKAAGQDTGPTETEGKKDTDTGSCDGPAGEEQAAAKTGKFTLKSSKSKELAAKEKEIMELKDKLLRSMAEFDNYRKRTEKEKAQMFDLGVKSTIEKILPIIDNFERGLDSIKEEEKDSPLAQGYNMIYKQLMTVLEEIGVTPIDAVGKEFNPDFHNAVAHGEDENLGENIVAEEYQKGYMYHDMVIRHSMVKVVN